MSSQPWLRIKKSNICLSLPHISRDRNSVSVTSVHTVQCSPFKKRKQIVVCCCRLSLIAFYHIFPVRPCMAGDPVLHADDTSVHLHTASVSGLAGEGGHTWSRVTVQRYLWATVSNSSLKKVLCFPANCENLRVKLIGVLIGALCAPLRYTAKMWTISEKWKLQKKSQAKKLF